MNPGRELDALVAEKVMGLRKDLTFIGYKWFKTIGHPLENSLVEDLPHYSTSIEAAWEVVEEMRYLKWQVKVLTTSVDYCATIVNLDHSKRFDTRGKSAPHAICMAALRAMGVKV